jgi:hypothetical protein
MPMIDPDFDPGEPWCAGLLAGIALVALATYLLLELAQSGLLVHPPPIFG